MTVHERAVGGRPGTTASIARTGAILCTVLAAACSRGVEGRTMASLQEVESDAGSPDASSAPMISVDGRAVAGFYEIDQTEPKRIGFAVIDAQDRLRPESLPAVARDDAAAVAGLRAAASAYLAKGRWRPMATPDRARFADGRDALHWKALNLSVTVTEEGSLWFSRTDSGDILGVTPFASTLVEQRGCALNMMYHNLVFNDVAGFDPDTRLAFVAFDVVEGNTDSAQFAPFRCDPSALVHVLRVAAR